MAAENQAAANGSSGRAGIALSVATLLKNMIGGGIFSLPIGLSVATPYAGLAIMASVGCLSACTFWMVGYCCLTWGAGSFRDLWVAVLGQKSSWIIDAVLFLNGWFTLVRLSSCRDLGAT
eukprot:TRINITY_DN51416_c0_g1_i1.p1 TRINITY_DN51416_c0_g1~~TRINITY_DN51416_c0_g1_i1.p1  ORF type:complete len:120 (+),score=15.76 TRINITY_DN51416_c0_g1_i1:161-520(+)